MRLITGAILKQICPRLPIVRAELLAEYINTICPEYGINSADILHEFLANLAHESNQFTRYEENLNYSARRLTEVWPNRFPNIEVAEAYAMNPKKLAERVYGGRKDLGNEQPGDGFAFRGSGPIQLTGRYNFTAFARWMSKKFAIAKTAQEWANLLRTNDQYALHSACWLFAISKQLIDEAIDDNMKVIVKRINGGYVGMAERMEYYELCKKLIA
jgi:putative chitinase